jgi:hypothetical protein
MLRTGTRVYPELSPACTEAGEADDGTGRRHPGRRLTNRDQVGTKLGLSWHQVTGETAARARVAGDACTGPATP